MNQAPQKPETAADLLNLISRGNIALLVTSDFKHGLRSRPMLTLKTGKEDRFLWFFTTEFSEKVEEIQANPTVNVLYVLDAGATYLSVIGEAELLKDRQVMERLWDDSLKAWIPGGLDNPTLLLIRVEPQLVECWVGGPGSAIQHFKPKGSDSGPGGRQDADQPANTSA